MAVGQVTASTGPVAAAEVMCESVDRASNTGSSWPVGVAVETPAVQTTVRVEPGVAFRVLPVTTEMVAGRSPVVGHRIKAVTRGLMAKREALVWGVALEATTSLAAAAVGMAAAACMLPVPVAAQAISMACKMASHKWGVIPGMGR
jgi:hypothetical protein